jgi:hypothetical protein
MKWQDAPAAEQAPTWQQAPALQEEPQLVPGLRAPEDPTTGALRSAEKAASAAGPSLARLFSGVVKAALSPVETAKGISDVAAGALRNLTPKALRELIDRAGDPEYIARIQEAARIAGGDIANRLGSREAIINTLETDPAGAMADISFVLGLGGAAAPGRIGASLTRASRIVDPMSAPIAALDLVAATPKAMMARPERRASNILQQTLGPERFALEDAMQRYPHLPPAEAAAAAGIVAPEFYALAEEANKLNVGNVFARRVANAEDLERNALAQMAGGGTQAAAQRAQKLERDALEATLGPIRERELAAANIAGRKLPGLEAKEAALGGIEKRALEDVRLAEGAVERARRGDYADEAGVIAKATEVNDIAAEKAKVFGDAARLATYAKDSLAAYNLRPLRADEINAQIDAVLRDPKYGTSKDVRTAMNNIKADIAQWTDARGVIDADALEQIRKFSVNEAAALPSLDPKAQKKLASKLTIAVKPMIIDAIERAGGTDYGKYLNDYAAGLTKVDQRKMAAKLLAQYKTSPKKFAATVRGDDKRIVEKTFGPGSYDIAVVMAPHMDKLTAIAGRIERVQAIKDQAEKGRRGMELIAELNQSKLKMPNWLNPKVALTNAALQGLEKYTDPRTTTLLAEALQSGKSTQELLNKVPIAERGRIFTLIGQSITKLEPFKVSTVGRSANALAPKEESLNALAPEDEE